MNKDLEERLIRVEKILGHFNKFDKNINVHDPERYTVSERLALLERHTNIQYRWNQHDKIPSCEEESL